MTVINTPTGPQETDPYLWPNAKMPGTAWGCACCEPHAGHPLPLCPTCQAKEARCCQVGRG